MENEGILCDKCGVALEKQPVRMKYLEYEVTEQLPCCPVCGYVYISEKLANGKIRKVEEQFEEK